jgi:hypothetical protein
MKLQEKCTHTSSPPWHVRKRFSWLSDSWIEILRTYNVSSHNKAIVMNVKKKHLNLNIFIVYLPKYFISKLLYLDSWSSCLRKAHRYLNTFLWQSGTFDTTCKRACFEYIHMKSATKTKIYIDKQNYLKFTRNKYFYLSAQTKNHIYNFHWFWNKMFKVLYRIYNKAITWSFKWIEMTIKSPFFQYDN